MANKDYTTIEIVDITIANLNNISIPAGLTEQIAIPLAQNINNLKILKQKLEAPPITAEVPAEEEGFDLGELDFEEKENADA